MSSKQKANQKKELRQISCPMSDKPRIKKLAEEKGMKITDYVEWRALTAELPPPPPKKGDLTPTNQQKLYNMVKSSNNKIQGLPGTVNQNSNIQEIVDFLYNDAVNKMIKANLHEDGMRILNELFSSNLEKNDAEKIEERYEKGDDAYNSKNYVAAFNHWKPLADAGHPESQYGLGLMYNSGRGFPKDYVEAMKWFRRAAEQGHSAAQYYVGNYYYHGQGVEEDYNEAEKWFRLSAVQGDVDAQGYLGWMYEHGQGVRQSNIRALMWYILAARDGQEDVVESRDNLSKTLSREQQKKAHSMAKKCIESDYQDC
jgi:tRNA U38,U39,U40 pseudouridine synthase TruA